MKIFGPEQQPTSPVGLHSVLDEVPKPIRRAVAAWTLGASVYTALSRTKSWYEDRVSYQIAVEGTDDMYPLIHDWLLKAIPSEKQRSLIVRTKNPFRGRPVFADEDLIPDTPKGGWLATFYDGTQARTVVLNGHKIRVEVEKDAQNDRFKQNSTRAAEFFRSMETIKLTAYTLGGRQAILDLLAGIQKELHNEEPRVRMFVGTKWGEWSRKNGVKRRDLSSVVLRKGVLEHLLDDLDTFLKADERYGELGLPHHRGYLLYGPPGTGKTSIVRALASHFDLALYILPLSDVGSDTNLLNLISSLPAGAVLLLEDIDIAADAPRDREEGGNDKGSEDGAMSLSGLLNSLDGISTPDGLIVVMTSNRPDVLDGALIRTGRVDLQMNVDYVDDEQLGRLTEYLTGERLDVVARPKLTPAEVIEVIKPHVLDPTAAREALLAEFGP